MTAIGPNFSNELRVAGLFGLAFSWDADGNIYNQSNLTGPQQTTLAAVIAAHNPATPDPYAGCQVVSTGTPSLSGTYSIDPRSLSDMQGEILSLVVNSTFTNGTTSLDWIDAAGASHTFDPTAFREFATKVGSYVGAIKLVAGSGTGTLPAQPVTIA